MSVDERVSLESADIMDILKALPHRYPFLMVDRIVQMSGCESCVGIKNVTINEPYFVGHFPEHPIMPGIMIVEGMAQTAGVMCILNAPWNEVSSGEDRAIYFLGIDEARFRKPVSPGDRLEYHVKTLQRRGKVCKFSAEGIVDGVRVANALFSAMIAN
ncbi:MAG: 3-hydroxyacyl-ACP dehydratase FabZ [Alphaproteobacteria bacterium]|nr:3-hydroxyacyl-ACP dehydratase FabZ [Alphaproteobacteria bacterium]